MLTNTQNILVVLLAVAASLIFTITLNKLWPIESRRVHNELIGWQVGILGTTNAVILGFMLYAVWSNLGAADLNADLEANALVNVYGLAEGLPSPQREQLRELARKYAVVVVDRDWEQMANDQIPDGSPQINREMWKTLMSVKTALPVEITAEDHALYELSSMTEHRRIRLLQSASRLPTVLWWVLLVGGFVTVGSASMFGTSSRRLHALQACSLSLLVSLTLVSVAAIDRPFQGTVHVSDLAFRRAQENMRAD